MSQEEHAQQFDLNSAHAEIVDDTKLSFIPFRDIETEVRELRSTIRSHRRSIAKLESRKTQLQVQHRQETDGSLYRSVCGDCDLYNSLLKSAIDRLRLLEECDIYLK